MNNKNQRATRFPLNQNARQRRRSAFTLIEITISFAILTALMGSALGLVTLAQRSQQRSKDSRVFRQEVRRFAKVFREDARGKNRQLILESVNELHLQRPDETISYQIVGNSQITRIQTGTDKRLERFEFGLEVEIELSQPDANDPVRWTLTEKRFPAQPITVIAGWRGTDS